MATKKIQLTRNTFRFVSAGSKRKAAPASKRTPKRSR